MKIQDLTDMWEKDGKIDHTDLTASTQRIPQLHNRYYKMYVHEGLKLRKMRTEAKKLYLLKTEYYRQELPKEDLDRYGWEPWQLKVMKQDLPLYIEADDDIINLNLKIALQEALVDYLESILRQIQNRGYHIKSIIDWEKFKVGA